MNEIVLSKKEKEIIIAEFGCSYVTLFRALTGRSHSYQARKIVARANQLQENRVERNRITNTESHA